MSAVDIMLRQSTSVRADFNYGLAVAVSQNYVFKMKFRALGEARWILGILAVCWLVSLAFFRAISLVVKPWSWYRSRTRSDEQQHFRSLLRSIAAISTSAPPERSRSGCLRLSLRAERRYIFIAIALTHVLSSSSFLS